MRPEHRALRPAWGENPQRPARYDAAGRKSRAVRASGGRSRSPGREDPDLHSARRGFSDDARTLSMEFAGYLRTAPAHAGKPHPGSVDQRWQPSRPRSTRYRAPSRSPSLVRSIPYTASPSTTRIRTGSRCKCVSTSCAIGAARPEPEPSDLHSRQFSRRGILFQSNQHHHRGLRAGPVERPARGLLRERQRGDSGRSDRVQPRPGPHLRSVAGRHVHRHAPYGVEVLQADGAGTVLITTGP